MTRRILGPGLALVCACSVFMGCESLRHETRSKADDTGLEAEDAKVGEVKSEAPKGFFKSSRLPGAMSDEGRDIERNLGIH